MEKILFGLIVLICLISCSSSNDVTIPVPSDDEQQQVDTFYRGADLSYVNEMIDCGALFYNEQGEENNAYQIFKAAGTNLIRVRLWHNPDWTDYSDFDDVKKTIARARDLDIKVLLDFHYSDDWADPQKQYVPAAWLSVVNHTDLLGDSIYNYTYEVLQKLNQENLLPEFVQVGNEINIEILQDPNQTYGAINWTRNAYLINKGLKAVRDAASQFDKSIKTFLHIAQPENAEWWFGEASQNGVVDYDWIGISYYPKWSEVSIDQLSNSISKLRNNHNKPLMVVETAYPYTLNDVDDANNILGEDAGISEFEISPQGQYHYLKTLEKEIIKGGGEGLIYWEPAWVSTSCFTRWGQGSHWDNATLFDDTNQANIGMRYFGGE